MHLTRWITGLIAAPILVLIISAGDHRVFTLFVALASIVALWEYYRLVFGDKERARTLAFMLVGYLSAPLTVWVAGTGKIGPVIALVAIQLLLSAFVAVHRYGNDADVGGLVAKQIQGIVYIPAVLALAVLIRTAPRGEFWIYAILLIIFAGDTGAYYAGSYFGKRRLCPSVSPKKTVVGAVGGLAANTMVALVLKLFFAPRLGWGMMILMAVCMGAAGQVGDLFESVLKRTADIKDSSAILPGHGGLLDRIDAFLFALPVAWAFLTI